jgi:hypothetical protein
MSRYILKSDSGGQTAIGWDNPMHTFFYQELDQDGDQIVWYGTMFEEYKTVEDLLPYLRCDGVEIDEGVIEKLKWDVEHAIPITPLQEQIRKMFNQ